MPSWIHISKIRNIKNPESIIVNVLNEDKSIFRIETVKLFILYLALNYFKLIITSTTLKEGFYCPNPGG